MAESAPGHPVNRTWASWLQYRDLCTTVFPALFVSVAGGGTVPRLWRDVAFSFRVILPFRRMTVLVLSHTIWGFLNPETTNRVTETKKITFRAVLHLTLQGSECGSRRRLGPAVRMHVRVGMELKPNSYRFHDSPSSDPPCKKFKRKYHLLHCWKESSTNKLNVLLKLF